jgi:hypothetical protein
MKEALRFVDDDDCWVRSRDQNVKNCQHLANTRTAVVQRRSEVLPFSFGIDGPNADLNLLISWNGDCNAFDFGEDVADQVVESIPTTLIGAEHV